MRILAIDDEFAALKKMEVLLSGFGECDAATNGSQARELYLEAIKEGNPYALIFIDIELPDTSGLDLLKYFAKVEGENEKISTKKIVVTAHSNPDYVFGARKYCDGFIIKPVKRTVLVDKLKNMGIEPTPENK